MEVGPEKDVPAARKSDGISTPGDPGVILMPHLFATNIDKGNVISKDAATVIMARAKHSLRMDAVMETTVPSNIYVLERNIETAQGANHVTIRAERP